MKVTRTDILLYAIDELKKDAASGDCSQEMIASAVGLTPGSLMVYLTRLSKTGVIRAKKRLISEKFLSNIVITEKGKEKLKAFRSRLDDLIFTPQRHNISTCLKFTELAGKFRSPLERTFLLFMYKSRDNFDLNQYMGNLTTATNDMNLLNFLRKLDKPDEEQGQRSYLIEVFNMTLYGDMNKMIEVLKGELSREDIDSLLIHAETKYKQGRLDEAEIIYKQLLSIQPNITINQWLQTNLGLAQVIRRKEGPKEAIAYLDRVGGETKGRLFRALLNQAKGTCFSMMGDYTTAIEMLSECIRSYRQYQYPLLISIAMNNRGVAYFSSGKIEQAEKDWSIALKMADKAHCRYAKGRLLGNLADVEVLKGNLKKAERYLNSSERLFRSVNDMEGVAAVEFNRALKSISEKDIEGLKVHFKRSEEIAYPLPPEYERSFRRKVMSDRAKEMGLEDIVSFINGCTKC